MKKIQVTDWIKILDFHSSQFHPETLKYLTENAIPVYKDNVLAEDIYNVLDILDSEERQELTPKITDDLEQVAILLNKRSAAYARIVYS